MGPLHVCLVTAFPPSGQRLNEYGFHLAKELQEQCVRVSILADKYSGQEPEISGFDVHRCWTFDSPAVPIQLIRTVRALRPDVVWFNLVYSTFGDSPLAAFSGLCTPWLSRMFAPQSYVTLHHLMENVDLADADISHPSLYRLGGSLATRLLLRASSVAVLLDGYRCQLESHYGAANVRVRRHGILSSRALPPDFNLRRRNGTKIVAFGKWGRYKRLELMLESFQAIRSRVGNVRLLIAGPNHPNRPGYVESLAAQYKDDTQIEFYGYVPDEDLATVFADATLVALPYSSSGGPSGVAHQACQFGLPIVAADIPDIMNLAAEQNIAVDYYRNGDAADLAARILRLIADEQRQKEMSEQNYRVGCNMTIPSVVQQYLQDFVSYQDPRKQVVPKKHPVAPEPQFLPGPHLKTLTPPVTFSVVVPAYNEESRLPFTLNCICSYLEKRSGRSEIIVVDDGSTDNTAALVERFADRHSRVDIRVIRLARNQGKGAAVKQGLMAAVGQWIAICDADLRQGFYELAKLEKALSDEGSDVAIASRWHVKQTSPHSQPFYRSVSGRLFGIAVRLLLRLPFRDTQCGLKLLNRTVAAPLFAAQEVSGWAYDCEFLLLCLHNGLRVEEVPVAFEHDYANSRFRLLQDSLRSVTELLRIAHRKRRGTYVLPEPPLARAMDVPMTQQDAA